MTQNKAGLIVKTSTDMNLKYNIYLFYLIIYLLLFCRLFPHKVGQIVKDFCDSGVEAVD